MCLQLSVMKTVYSSTFGGVALMSAENSTASGELPANSKSTSGPRTTLHIPSARATIPVHAALRRRFTATCATPKPSMHSPMAGSTEGCTATAAQQKNVKRPRCLHLLRSTKSKAKRSVTGRIRNLRRVLVLRDTGCQLHPDVVHGRLDKDDVEQGVDSGDEDRGPLALDYGKGQGVDHQQGHYDERGCQVSEHQFDRVQAGDAGEGCLLEQPSVDLRAGELGDPLPEVRVEQSEPLGVREVLHPRQVDPHIVVTAGHPPDPHERQNPAEQPERRPQPARRGTVSSLPAWERSVPSGAAFSTPQPRERRRAASLRPGDNSRC